MTNATDEQHTMKRVIVDHFGGPDVVRVIEHRVPRPGPGEVRVRILPRACRSPTLSCPRHTSRRPDYTERQPDTRPKPSGRLEPRPLTSASRLSAPALTRR